MRFVNPEGDRLDMQEHTGPRARAVPANRPRREWAHAGAALLLVGCGAASPRETVEPPPATAAAEVWSARCGACHVPVQPGARSRDALRTALERHRDRVRLDEQQVGPVGMDQMRNAVKSGQMTGETPVWRQGLTGWNPAHAVAELSGLFGPPAGPPPFGAPSGGPPPFGGG